jgi:hypothetical protein
MTENADHPLVATFTVVGGENAHPEDVEAAGRQLTDDLREIGLRVEHPVGEPAPAGTRVGAEEMVIALFASLYGYKTGKMAVEDVKKLKAVAPAVVRVILEFFRRHKDVTVEGTTPDGRPLSLRNVSEETVVALFGAEPDKPRERDDHDRA